MPRLLIPILTLLLFPFCAQAQHNTYDFTENDGINSGETTVSGDPLLFLRPLGGDDIYLRLSEFGFSNVSWQYRGLDNSFDKHLFAGLDMDGGLSRTRNYRLYDNLSRMGFFKKTVSDLPGGTDAYTPGFVEQIYGSPFEANYGSARLSLFGYNHNGRISGRASYNFLNEEWAGGIAGSYRTGRDGSVDGVFNEEVSATIVLGRKIADVHTLTFIGDFSWYERGTRSYTTARVFELSGNKRYNPAWGIQDGKQRNSRVSDHFLPAATLLFEGKAGDDTRIEAAVSVQAGELGYSALIWYDAATPYPDYYRHLPDFIEHDFLRREIYQDWRAGNPSVTQVNWDRLHYVNHMSDEDIAFLLERRVERVTDVRVTTKGRTSFTENWTLGYGFNLSNENTRFFKTAKDLLGGSPFIDIDQYLTDDFSGTQLILNNLREPGRRIGTGDRFGYDYTLNLFSFSGRTALEYDTGRISAIVSAEVGNSALVRTGHYEKTNLPGTLSFGRSPLTSKAVRTLSLSGRYSLSATHIFLVSLHEGTKMPYYGTVFTAPQYSNAMTDAPSVKYYSASASYLLTDAAVRSKISLFYTGTRNETAVYRYYDDLENLFSNMVLKDISKRSYGVELGLTVALWQNLDLNIAVSRTISEYNSNPHAEIYEDATQQLYAASKSHLDGYDTGNTPRWLSAFELRYSRFGWAGSLSYSYSAGRYIAPNPLRRMERIFLRATSPDYFNALTRSEKLPDAQSINATFMRTFYISGNPLTLFISVNNVLGSDNIYNGYEQMRLSRNTSGDSVNYEPFPSKYLYSYGRSYYLSLSYRFR